MTNDDKSAPVGMAAVREYILRFGSCGCVGGHRGEGFPDDCAKGKALAAASVERPELATPTQSLFNRLRDAIREGQSIGYTPTQLAECVLSIVSVERAAAPAQPVTEPPPPREPPKRTCNRHDDCDAANAKAKAAGRFSADHCHDDCCEDCFGS